MAPPRVLTLIPSLDATVPSVEALAERTLDA